MAIIVYPQSKREYAHTQGQYFDMYNWKFGLPPLSSDRCGALPFRNEISGLNSPWCLRGEDWEFLHNWAVDRYWLVDYTVWIDDHGQMPWPVPDVFPVPTKGPERQLLSTMHYDLSCLSGYWGKDFAWQDCAFDSRNDVEEALRSCLQPIDPLNQFSLSSTEPLKLSQMYKFFEDIGKFKCTICPCEPKQDGVFLYQFNQQYGQPATIESHYLNQCYLNLGARWPNIGQDRQYAFDVQLIALLACTEMVTGQPTKFKWVLTDIFQAKDAMIQNFTDEHQFVKNMQWGGNRAANQAAAAASMNPRPTAPEGGSALFECECRGVYAVVWPYFLAFK